MGVGHVFQIPVCSKSPCITLSHTPSVLRMVVVTVCLTEVVSGEGIAPSSHVTSVGLIEIQYMKILAATMGALDKGASPRLPWAYLWVQQ